MTDNELIAEFMELPTQDGVEDGYTLYSYTDWEGGEWAYDKNNLAYDTSWDWLMPVVDEIESQGYVVDIESTLECFHVSIRDAKNSKLILRVVKHKDKRTRLETVFIAVVEFIKWHNQQKS